MEEHDIYLNVVLGLCVALSLASILFLVSKKFKLIPYTVFLLLTGLIISQFELEPLETIRLTPESVLYIYLPILLFESAFNFDYREFRRILTPAFLLATIGLLISALIVSLPLKFIFDIPFPDAFMYGSIISSTDPIAVLSTFKQLGVPKKLQLLVDAESYLNDGMSVIMQKILIGFIPTAALTQADAALNGSPVLTGALQFIFVIVGGIISGAVLGFVISTIISKIKNVSSVEIILTIIAAHLVFIISDHFINIDIFGQDTNVSGIIAILVAGIVMGNYGRTKISPSISHNMHLMWDFLVFVVTSLVFLLIGYEINIEFLVDNIDLITLSIIALLIGRSIATYTIFGSINIFAKNKGRIPLSWMHVSNLGGLRGALPLILVLLLPDSYEYKDIFVGLVLGAILFTLTANALSIEPVIKFLGLNKLNTSNKIELKITKAIILKRIVKHLQNMRDIEEICEKTYKETRQKVLLKLAKTLESLEKMHDSKTYNNELEKVLRRYCINIEKSVYADLFKRGIIPELVYNKLKTTLVLQLECIEEGREQFDKTGYPQLHDKNCHVGSYSIKPNLIDKFLSYFQKNSEIDQLLLEQNYLYHKARLFGDEKVIDELKDFTQDELIPNKTLKKMIAFYNDLIEYNHKTIEDIEQCNQTLTKNVEIRFITAETDHLIKYILEEFGEQGRISVQAIKTFKLNIQ